MAVPEVIFPHISEKKELPTQMIYSGDSQSMALSVTANGFQVSTGLTPQFSVEMVQPKPLERVSSDHKKRYPSTPLCISYYASTMAIWLKNNVGSTDPYVQPVSSLLNQSRLFGLRWQRTRAGLNGKEKHWLV